MDHDTAGSADATVLLDLEGLMVRSVSRAPDGSRAVTLQTADECANACPECAVFAHEVKAHVCTRPRDLPAVGAPVRLVWRKRRWWCREPLCPRRSFTESLPVLPARARITTRTRALAGDLVVDGIAASVQAAARVTGLAWATVMDAVRIQADRVLAPQADPVEVSGIDEVRRGRPRWRTTEPPATPDPTPTPGPTPTPTPMPGPTPTEPVVVRQREPAKARVLADRWHVGFTDISGRQGMLGQVEGRTGDGR